jgi:DNA-directed RNA polymerase subunit RPC12/RpoP
MLIYDCEACGAQFEIDPDNPPEFGVFCPECGETEIIKEVKGPDATCNVEDTVQGIPRRG